MHTLSRFDPKMFTMLSRRCSFLKFLSVFYELSLSQIRNKEYAVRRLVFHHRRMVLNLEQGNEACMGWGVHGKDMSWECSICTLSHDTSYYTSCSSLYMWPMFILCFICTPMSKDLLFPACPSQNVQPGGTTIYETAEQAAVPAHW